MNRRPYMTKIWLGRRYRYLNTRRRYHLRIAWRLGIVSYLRRDEPDTRSSFRVRGETIAQRERAREFKPRAGSGET